MRAKIALNILLGAVGIAILTWLIIQADPARLVETFSKAHGDWLAAAFLTVLIWLGFRTLRWQNILRTAGIAVRFKPLYQITLVGLFIDFMTPIYRAGSEPVRTLMLKKYFKIESSKGIATIMVDRFFDFLIFFSLSVISLVLLLPRFSFNIQAGMLATIMAFVGALVFTIYLSLNAGAAYKFVVRFVRIMKKIPSLRSRAKGWEARLRGQVQVYTDTVRQGFFLNTAINALLSIILISLEIIRFQLLILALGLQLDIFWIVIAFGAVVIAGIIPSPPGGVGIVEPVGIGVLVFAGLSIPQATSLIFLDRIVTMVFISLLGAGAAYKLGMSFGKKTKIGKLVESA